MGILIRPDGKIINVSPNNEESFRLEELQNLVEGYIEEIPNISRMREGVIALANEEGKLRGMPFNTAASHLLMIPLVGNVLLLSPKEYFPPESYKESG